MPWCYVALAVSMCLSVGLGVGLLVQRRRWQRRLEQALVLPEWLPTGETLDQLEARFRRTLGRGLLAGRLARIYAALFEQDAIRPYVKDRYLAQQIEAGVIDNNTALFQCAAAVEEAHGERTFRGNAANTLGSYLRNQFKKHGWAWPKHPYDWKEYFLNHHRETLS